MATTASREAGAAEVRGEAEIRGEAEVRGEAETRGDAQCTADAMPAERSLRSLIRDIPDFPREGVLFKDITPLLADPKALALAVDSLAELAQPLQPDCVLAAEARGFLLGPALALRLGAGFVLARKPGKLPHQTIAAEYALEYGSDSLELHADAIKPGSKVLVHDDLLATGGTAKALCELAQRAGGTVVGCGFLIELAFLAGREQLTPHETHALLRYDA
ncbi:MAG TPA: adenine phosphoribosyltransferase [Solirubrobacteraceae bacterium]|jgi:adenine phosphoribosyltransferase